jgi:hypothetical protein
MLRSKGVNENINNNYIGHKHGVSDQENYGGVYKEYVRQEINRMEYPWLKYKNELDQLYSLDCRYNYIFLYIITIYQI